jgi:cbb3-type cytochrome oxidase subunit 3
MAFTDMDESDDDVGERPPEDGEGGSNRTFVLIAAILGGITLLALLCTAIYAFVYLPRTRTQRENAAQTAYAQETMLAFEATQAAMGPTATNTKQVVEEPKASPTPVLAEEEAEITATPTADSVQATQDALDTVVAAAQTQNPTVTQLPTSGFADEVGAPGLLAMAVVLIVVIFLVRRLRTS